VPRPQLLHSRCEMLRSVRGYSPQQRLPGLAEVAAEQRELLQQIFVGELARQLPPAPTTAAAAEEERRRGPPSVAPCSVLGHLLWTPRCKPRRLLAANVGQAFVPCRDTCGESLPQGDPQRVARWFIGEDESTQPSAQQLIDLTLQLGLPSPFENQLDQRLGNQSVDDSSATVPLLDHPQHAPQSQSVTLDEGGPCVREDLPGVGQGKDRLGGEVGPPVAMPRRGEAIDCRLQAGEPTSERRLERVWRMEPHLHRKAHGRKRPPRRTVCDQLADRIVERE
jgi:hypothetical protein